MTKPYIVTLPNNEKGRTRVLYRQRDPVQFDSESPICYKLLDGVLIQERLTSTNLWVCTLLTKGALFGEEVISGDASRLHTIRILPFYRRVNIQCLPLTDEIKKELTRATFERYREREDLFSNHSVTARVEWVLRRYPDIPLTSSFIGTMIASSREQVSRMRAKMPQ